jgi:hypothetical protein
MVLSEDDAKLFYRLMCPLQFFVNCETHSEDRTGFTKGVDDTESRLCV